MKLISRKFTQAKTTSSAGNRLLVLMAFLILLAAMAVTGTPVHAQSGAEDVGKNRAMVAAPLNDTIDLTPYVSSYVDATQSLGLQDILGLPQSAFEQTTAIPSFGYTTDIIWHQVKLGIEGTLAQSPTIEVGPSYLNFIDLYLFKADQGEPIWQVKLGDNIPASERPVAGTAQLASLPVLEPGEYRLIIRVESNSANLLRLKLWPANDLIASLTTRNVATNIFFGLIVTLGLAYLALGLMLRDVIVATYGVWVAAVGTTVAIVNGIALGVLRPELPWVNDLLLGVINIISYCGTVLLWMHIVELRKRMLPLYLFGIAYACVIFGFVVSSTNDLYTVFGTYIVPSHSAFMILMCVFLAIRAVQDWRNWLNWAYLILLVLPTGPAVLLQLSHSGLIDATPARLELHQFTLLFHLTGMAILMAARLSYLDQERRVMTIRAAETTNLVEEQRNLISMLSHEFRTPLAVIQRSSEMLMLRLKNHRGDVLERLQRIQLQARKLARLVDVFLSKDGIDTHDLSLERTTVQVDRFLAEFAAQTTREGAEILVTCHETAGAEVFIDETLMALAITNLIETSRRFAHGRPIHINLYRPKETLVEIRIPCSGDELDDTEIGLIADALFRRDMETQALSRALGLNISQRIVASHGGSITLRDRGGTGIELCLILPSE